MQIRQFEYALKAAEEGSITRAAEQLYISQQALSESLRLLENELGFSIFQRSRKGVTPTATGQQFLDDLASIMPVIDKWRDYAKTDSAKTTVRIYLQYALRSLLSDSHLLETLSGNTTSAIEWHSLNGLQAVETLQKEHDAIALLMLEKGDNAYQLLSALVASGNYVLYTLTEVQMALILQADDPLARKETLTPCDLADHRFVCHQISRHLKANNLFAANNAPPVQLPEIVDIPTFISQHPGTFAYVPDLSAKNNLLVTDHKIVLRPLEVLTTPPPPLSCLLLHHREASSAATEITQLITNFFTL